MYVEMRNIYKQYGNFRASDNVSFGIEKGKLMKRFFTVNTKQESILAESMDFHG